MIDAELLRTLGWKKDLIDEVIRTAESLRSQPLAVSPSSVHHVQLVASSSRAIQFDPLSASNLSGALMRLDGVER